MFLCTWTILHLNVPPQLRPLPPPKSGWERLRRSFFTTWYAVKPKIKWMTIVIFFPEWPLGFAIQRLVEGRKFQEMVKNFQRVEKVDEEIEWTMTHTMYANMGGFVVKFPIRDNSEQPSNQIATRDTEVDELLNKFQVNNQTGHRHLGPFYWDPHPGHYALAKSNLTTRGQRYSLSLDGCAVALSGNVWSLNAGQLLEARRCGIIAKFPDITENEISDKNKDDMLIKVLALLQVVWLCIQIVIRAVEEKQSSQLEVTALAMAICAFVTYLLLIWQPKDVYTPTSIVAQSSPDQAEFDKLVLLSFVPPFPNGRKNPATSNFSSYPSSSLDYRGVMFGLVIFGAIHLVAWNFQFPSAVEQLLWRISSLAVVCLPLALLASESLLAMEFERLPPLMIIIIIFLVYFFVFFFCLARIFLLVEAFRSTYYLPPSSYIATWANNMPHLA
jgi:hypothetical protein